MSHPDALPDLFLDRSPPLGRHRRGAASVAVRRKRLRLASGEVIEDNPKSRAGRRTVALPAVLVAGLARHRARYGGEADDYVFTSEEGTPLERSNFRQRVWLPAAGAAGLGE